MSGFGVISMMLTLILHASSSLVHCADKKPEPGDADFGLSTYCKSMCKWGRGGNLCNCHAAYFAGKRSSPSSSGSDAGQARVAPSSSTDVDLPSTDDCNDDASTTMAVEHRPLTKLPAGRQRRSWTKSDILKRRLRPVIPKSLGILLQNFV